VSITENAPAGDEMRVGVDVGGTNTDAVLMDRTVVREAHKAPTTANVSDGVIAAIRHVLDAAGTAPGAIQSVMLGTTHFTNAFVERRGLLEVGVLRLALPATRGLPPMIDWPHDLGMVIGRHRYLVRGGHQFDGRPIAALDEAAVTAAARDMRARGLKAVAISAVFSPVNSEMEERAADLVRAELPEASITLSSRIGRLGLLERENAAIMNASLAELSMRVVASFRSALRDLAIDAPFYLSQNDGTLMSAEFVEKYPVMTFACGPTNSMRGAAYLSGISDAVVADIGGTTTDFGVLVKGFPRESSVTADVGGVRTNFRMPDILSVGLGGGSLVHRDKHQEERVCIGPKSLGFALTESALVFGGDTLTTTDIAVAAGYAELGDPELIRHLEPSLVRNAVDEIHRILEEGVDRMKTSAAPVPLILVGGGSILVKRDIAGTSEVVIPPHAGVANAVGASIAQVAGEVDKLYSYDMLGREAALDEARATALAIAVEAGAVPDSIAIIDLEELPLAYMPGNQVRIRAKAAGELERC
jgi:N-methylhydantoinase A/oxoprolinase/acetone carboxylase beta subunit